MKLQKIPTPLFECLQGCFHLVLNVFQFQKRLKKWQNFEPFDSKYYIFFFYLLVSNMWILKVLLKKSKFWMIEWRYSTNSWLTERDTLMKLKWSEFSLVKIEKKKAFQSRNFIKFVNCKKNANIQKNVSSNISEKFGNTKLV